MDLELNPSLFLRKLESNTIEVSVFLTLIPAERRGAPSNARVRRFKSDERAGSSQTARTPRRFKLSITHIEEHHAHEPR
ncbi:MAG: hypothetical protein ACREEA_01890, partial [Stellaceae bacterium]